MSLSYTSHGEITWMSPHCHDRCPDNAIEERMRGDDAKGRPGGTVGRHWSDAAINFQEATFLEAQSHQNLGEQGGSLPWSLWRLYHPGSILVSDSWLQELLKKYFSAVLSHQVGGNL